jgi:imidazolonepropionase-like amidohydrolase
MCRPRRQLRLPSNVKVFDGKSNALREGLTVSVEGNKIASVDARKPIGDGVQIIDGGGRTLMPGLIDNHWHAMMAAMGINLTALLLVDGNPLDDISLIADPARNFKIIMKDGVIYKNTLPG